MAVFTKLKPEECHQKMTLIHLYFEQPLVLPGCPEGQGDQYLKAYLKPIHGIQIGRF